MFGGTHLFVLMMVKLTGVTVLCRKNFPLTHINPQFSLQPFISIFLSIRIQGLCYKSKTLISLYIQVALWQD